VPNASEIDRICKALKKVSTGSSDFDLNPEVILPAGRKLRPAAVLIPLLPTDAGVQVIMTKRSSALKHHPWQISFPGGKVEADDGGPVQAAQREAFEEIGLAQNNTRVLGWLPTHETVTGFSVTPVLAVITGAYEPRPEPGEVAEIFSVPLAHITDLTRFQTQSRLWQGVMRYYDTVPYGPYYIWGATARILRRLAERMAS